MEIIGKDFQGWPEYKMNLKDVLEHLGFDHNDGKWSINDNDPKLNAYIRDLEDDGMGYGVMEMVITEVDYVESQEGNFINIFRETVDPNFDKSEFDEKLWQK